MQFRASMRHTALALVAGGALVTSVAVLPVASSASTVTMAAAPASSATLVRTTLTSQFSPPSPDPAGITYLRGRDQLMLSDSEVEEMSIYAGANLFVTTRLGTLTSTGTTVGWSNEPTGLGYNPANGHLFVSDDDADEVYEVAPGPDGRHGTSDDTITHFDTRETGNADAEGGDFDVTNGHVYVIDGVGTEVYDYSPGVNGSFDGVPPQGDDTVSHFDVSQYGARDPEGIASSEVRGTLFVLDHSTETIYELTKTGGLVQTISVSAANPTNAAGLALAPASNGSGATNLYIVDRGIDNDSNPNENDGKMYEMSAALPPIGNLPPDVLVGSDQTVTLPDSAALSATVTDDGLPNPPGTVTTTWTKLSGPGTVTFADASALATTASFSEPGTYVLQINASDSELADVDDVIIQVLAEGSPVTFDVAVSASSDDAEERPTGGVSLASSDLELVYDGADQQTVGVRFAGVQVPQGATVLSANIQFETDEVSPDAAALTIEGQAADNAPTFQATGLNVSSRPRTANGVAWSPPAWNTVGQRGAAQRTPDLWPIVQEIVDRPGWNSGDGLAFIFTGSGRRTAEAFDGTFAPVLHVEYLVGGSVNRPPLANAGVDLVVELPDSATLSGSVSDDGLPNTPGVVTTSWSKVSGPGTVTFADASTPSTTASFSASGTYVLRLTADDGELTDTDDLTVQVQPAGVTHTLDIALSAGSDDAEQRVSSGAVNVTSNDLELVYDKANQQVVGVRFAGVSVPRGATITNAFVQFQVDEVSNDVATLTIQGQAADNAATFQTVANNISSRPQTLAQVLWNPPAWPTVGVRGPDQRTSDLSAILQEIVNRPGWAGANAIAFVITGSGRRTAESFEGTRVPLLHIEYHR